MTSGVNIRVQLFRLTMPCRFFISFFLYLICLWLLKANAWGLHQDNLAADRPFGSKIVEFTGSTANPEILLLGSSMACVPAVACDEEIVRKHKKAENIFYFYNGQISHYSKALYLERALARETGRQIHVANMALPTSMIADYEFLLKEILQAGKKPKAIVICLSWRDLLDHNYRTSAVQQAVRYAKTLNSQDMARKQHLSWLQPLYQQERELKEAIGLLQKHIAATYSGLIAKAKLNRVPGESIGCFNNRPAQESIKPMDRSRFLPIDRSLMSTHIQSLKHLSLIAAQNNIPLVLVDLPTAQECESMIPASVLQDYRHQLRTASQQPHVLLLELSKYHQFQRNQFEDELHLNAEGGKIFFDQTASYIAGHKQNLL